MVVIGAFWLLGFVDRVVMPLLARSGVETAMPDLRRLHWTLADSICRRLRIDLVRARTRADDKIRPGVVVDQYPAAGTFVKPGRRVEVVVTDQAGLAVCPNVAQRSPREAAIIADSSGLAVNLEAVRYRHSDSEPEGIVIAQAPPAYTGVLPGTELILTVSLGPASSSPTVPELVGRNISEVVFLLAQQELKLGEVARYPDRSRVPGTVIGQSPSAGSLLPGDGKVAIKVAALPVASPLNPTDSLLPDRDSI